MSEVLKDQIALITGGSRGIGKEICRKFLIEGATVFTCSRDQKELESLSTELQTPDSRLHVKVFDVSHPEECQDLIDWPINIHHRLDILVNNAGIYGPIGSLDQTSISDWEELWKINFLGVVNCSRFATIQMKKQHRGKIINLAGAGVGSDKVLPNASAYFSSKMAVVGFTECLAADLSDFNIQVNAISPGFILTKLTEPLEEQNSKRISDSPELAANLAVFLASDNSDQVTGRLISAKWDDISTLDGIAGDPNKYKLRRINEHNFFEKKA